jgi:IS30 family transposase
VVPKTETNGLKFFNELKDDWSSEIIVEKLKIDYPDDVETRISHETICRWIYLEAKGGGTLYHHLRRRRKKRRRQKRYGSGRRLRLEFTFDIG